MNNIKAVIFDLDGTLLDTLDDLADSVNRTMSKFGWEIRTIEEIRSFVGNGVGLLIKRSMPEGTEEYFEKCLSMFRDDYSQNMLFLNQISYNVVLNIFFYFFGYILSCLS